MSNNHMSIFSRFVMSCCAVIALSVLAVSPAFAQYGITAGKTLFPVKGVSNVLVSASGDLQGSPSECPFSDYDLTKITAAFAAAKDSDPDSCPHAVDAFGANVYFRSCKTVYLELSQKAADVIHPTTNTNIACCYARPGVERDRCKGDIRRGEARDKIELGYAHKIANVIPDSGNVLSAEELRKLQAAKKEKAEIDKQCFDDSFNRIGQYWAQKRGVSCIRFVSRAVKALIQDGTRGLKDAMLTQTTVGASSTMMYGAMTAVASMPSGWGLGAVAASAVNFASNVVTLASQASDILGTLSDSCGNVLPELKQLQQWRKTVLGTNLCQAAENLLERQLTQCIRVNLTASSALNLPQFSLMLQCPVNINMNVNISPRGFDCYARVSAGSPIALTGGRRSLLSGGGGLENLFNGNCFTSPTTRPGSGGITPPATTVDKRVPGVDCGPLDPSDLKKEPLKGTRVLAQSRTANGWAIGGKETVNGQQITRCDLYDNNRHIRTAFVYGDGSSCRAQEGGFISSSYETNTLCYGGGYVPATGPNVPDACMYDVGCLNASGNLDTSKIGTASCQNAQPVFNASRVYNTFVSGGISSPAQNRGNSCADFADVDPNSLKDGVCCDPQREDCRMRDANVPLCVCDEGDASNRIKVDAMGVSDRLGRCAQGGKATCCSPRLNGGQDSCTTQINMPICEAEKVDECIATDDKVTYVGPDGNASTRYTAAQVAQSKPSPYLYLFVRPDVTMPDGKQCCTTEWCNVCPQHYANAYGLSLVGNTSYMLPKDDADNHRIIGRGWPYLVNTGDEPAGEDDAVDLDAVEKTQYRVGLSQVPGLWVDIRVGTKDREQQVRSSAMPLHLNNSLKLPASLDACNRLSPLRAMPMASESFTGGSSSMGFVFNYNVLRPKKAAKWTVYASVPEPQEYPMDYLNRLRRGVRDGEGLPLAPITLCSDVDICTPEASGGLLGGGGITPASTPAAASAMRTAPQAAAVPAATQVPSAQQVAPAQSAAPVAVPSATPSVTPSATDTTGSGSGKYGLF